MKEALEILKTLGLGNIASVITVLGVAWAAFNWYDGLQDRLAVMEKRTESRWTHRDMKDWVEDVRRENPDIAFTIPDPVRYYHEDDED